MHRASASSSDDIVVDPDPDDAGIVVVAGSSDRVGIIQASPEGLAQCLLRKLKDPLAQAVWTSPGSPRRRGLPFVFPRPVGIVRGTPGELPVGGPFAGVGAFGARRSLVCVDDRRFMEAVCMAAGAAVASTSLTRPTPVWEHADEYIGACEELGLVVAEAVSP